ncbi:MAG TPA: glycosyltransferase family 9 protein [Bryobacteraceae bacterium]|nr:glycosyltransferase family 9 protein [Bryobacteraceae bacterium]
MRRLLIRPGGIGDCITCFPVMEWLHADYTEVWVPGAVVPLVQFANQVRSIAGTGLDLLGLDDIEIPAGLGNLLSAFDEIVSWYGSNRAEFRGTARELNTNWRFLPALPPKELTRHVTDFHAAHVGAPIGMMPRIHVSRMQRRETIVIHPFSGGRVKNWPLANFRELAQRLPFPVEWTAGPEEELPEARRFDNLLELAEWIAEASLYIGNDSGITHLAASTGVPTIGLYSSTNAKVWKARGERMQCIVRSSVEEISVEDVMEAVESLSRPQLH